MPNFDAEKAHLSCGRVPVGVDEVGRGCLAGPVVAAAVALPREWFETSDKGDLGAAPGWWWQLNDSKKLTPKNRERLAGLVRQFAAVQVGWCSVEEVDRLNILHASLEAMRRALVGFQGYAQTVLVDGHIDPYASRYFRGAQPFKAVETLVKGDGRSLSIAAASIIAKVYRDQWMTELGGLFPGYGFESHKGYSAPVHNEGLARLGPCVLHRRSFSPIKELVMAAGSGACNTALGEQKN